MPETNNFEDLIKQYHPMIYKICRVYSNREDFDDLYQEVLINLWRSLKTFEERSKLSTWLYRVVLNTALTYQRNSKKEKAKVPIDNILEIVDADNDREEREIKIEQLYSAISQLKKNERSIILLYLDEKSYDEIADITGLTISNVGVKISRLKNKLFKILNQA
jgi:RNA polymerase sigma-70 factor (ECF subfamily)